MTEQTKEIPYESESLRKYLWAKLRAAEDLFKKGEITRPELFRCEVDLSIMCDSGPIKVSAK